MAAMALMNLAPEVMKPSALFLNLVVGTIATVRFARAGYFSWTIYWPFAVTSIPFSFLGGAIHLPNHLYKAAVGAILLFAAVRLFHSAAKKQVTPTKPAPILAAIGAGAAIGLLAGLTGTGGGIFLSPLLLLANWAPMRETAGVSAAFVLTNSFAGLAGNLASVRYLPPQIPFWAIAAALGGLIGSEIGTRRAAPRALRFTLAAVLVIASYKMFLLAFS